MNLKYKWQARQQQCFYERPLGRVPSSNFFYHPTHLHLPPFIQFPNRLAFCCLCPRCSLWQDFFCVFSVPLIAGQSIPETPQFRARLILSPVTVGCIYCPINIQRYLYTCFVSLCRWHLCFCWWRTVDVDPWLVVAAVAVFFVADRFPRSLRWPKYPRFPRLSTTFPAKRCARNPCFFSRLSHRKSGVKTLWGISSCIPSTVVRI